MTVSLRSWAPLCAVLALAVVSGCNQAKAKANPKIDIDIAINSPTAPTPPAVPQSVELSPPGDHRLTRRVNPETDVCEVTLQFSARVIPADASQAVTYHLSSHDGFSISATGLFRAWRDTEPPLPTVIQVWATASNGVRSNTVNIRVVDECPPGTDNPNPPSPGPGPTADIKANGQDGSTTVEKDSLVVFSWSFTNAPHCNLSSTNGSLNFMVGGPGAQTVKVSAPMSATLTCPGTNGGTATDTVQVNISSSQPSPSLTVSPSSLTFQRGGTGCPATGSQVITISANNPITIRSENTAMATVSASNLPAGNNQQVLVTQQGSAVGVTHITITAGGRTETVALQFNPCQAQAACPTNVAYTPAPGTVGVNQVQPYTLLQQSGWPSHCGVIGLTDGPSRIHFIATGAILEVCSGGQCNHYFEGKIGTVKGVAPGSAQGITQGIIMENGRWTLNAPARFSATWTVIAQGLQAFGLKMPESNQTWVTDPRFPGKKICLTWQCQ